MKLCPSKLMESNSPPVGLTTPNDHRETSSTPFRARSGSFKLCLSSPTKGPIRFLLCSSHSPINTFAFASLSLVETLLSCRRSENGSSVLELCFQMLVLFFKKYVLVSSPSLSLFHLYQCSYLELCDFTEHSLL